MKSISMMTDAPRELLQVGETYLWSDGVVWIVVGHVETTVEPGAVLRLIEVDELGSRVSQVMAKDTYCCEEIP